MSNLSKVLILIVKVMPYILEIIEILQAIVKLHKELNNSEVEKILKEKAEELRKAAKINEQ